MQPLDARRFIHQPRRDFRNGRRVRLLQQSCACGALRLCQKRVEQRLRLWSLGIDARQQIAKPRDRRMIGRVESVALLDLGDHRRAGRRSGHAFTQFALRLLGIHQHLAKDALLVERFGDRGRNLEVAEQPEQRFNRCRIGFAPQPGRDHLLTRLDQQCVALVFLKHRKIERNARFARKPVQHAFAESVDGLDLEPARRFQRMREQRPRPLQHGGIGWRPVERGQFTQQLAIAGQRPAAEPFRDAAAHLRRRRLGVGEAEDLLGLHLAQQQPQHPRRQHIGLARAGIGRHPHGTARVRSHALALGNPLRHRAEKAPAHGSSTPEVSVHSSVRARWS